MEGKEMVSIPWEEYRELLMIKGRYEELKSHKFSYGIDWGHKDSVTVPYKGLDNPISYYGSTCPPITVKEM